LLSDRAVMLSLKMAVGGTMAYLQITDEDVYVMTLGNVYINQLEKERIEQSDDNTADTNIKDFTQGKPLYPGVYDGVCADWARDENGDQVYQEFSTGGNSAMWTDKAKNTVDKIVFVENTGKSPAYVRTWFAFEQGNLSEEEFEDVLGQNINDTHWDWETVGYGIEIDGNTYAVKVATYKGNAGTNKDVHPNGVLPAGETTRPSLLQTMLYKTATNEDMEAIDGNGNGTYDILVFSQAVQTEGFANAKEALDEAFDKYTIPWEKVVIPELIFDYNQMLYACFEDGSYTIGVDFDMPDMAAAAYGYNVEFDLNGHELTHVSNQYTLCAMYDGKLHLQGDGIVNMTKGFLLTEAGEVIVDGGTYKMTVTDTIDKVNKIGSLIQNNSKMIINDGVFEINVENAALFYATTNGVLEINGGFFQNTEDKTPDLLSIGTNGSHTNRIILKGGTFVNYNPKEDKMAISLDDRGITYGQLGGPWIVIDNGYEVVSEEKSNGDIWYKVVKK